MEPTAQPIWNLPTADVLRQLGATAKGLSSAEASARLKRYAASQLAPKKRTDTFALLLGQFSSPIFLMLVGAAVVSIFLHDTTDALIILLIVVASGLLGFWQERGAAGAVEKLLSLVEVKAKVLREGGPVDVAVREVVPGDVIVLSAGATAPGDCLLLESCDLFADEATLTGETFPAEKSVTVLPANTPLGKRTNLVFLGTHVVSKTGTLTEGEVALQSVNRLDGQESEAALLCVYLNAAFETGFSSPIDAAVRNHCTIDISAWKKLDGVPYDFLRKRLTVLVTGPDGNVMITKGALAQVLEVCTTAEIADGTEQPMDSVRKEIDQRFADYSRNGQRTLGLARVKFSAGAIGKVDEADMCFIGFVLFSDPLKPGIAATIERLKALGVSLKVISGNNALVAASVGRQIGFANASVLSGAEMKNMSDGALLNRVGKVDVFAEVEADEKERIIRALRKAGILGCAQVPSSCLSRRPIRQCRRRRCKRLSSRCRRGGRGELKSTWVKCDLP